MPRPKGSKNKATIEREKAAEIAAMNAAAMRAITRAEGIASPLAAKVPLKKLGKDILEDFANLFAGMAALYQPWPIAMGKNPNEDEAKFERYSGLALQAATALTPFQSPRLSAVAIGAAVVNKVEVTGGMPDDFVAQPYTGEPVEPGTIISADPVDDVPGVAAA